MDPPNLLTLIAGTVVLVFLPRFAVRSMGVTGDLIAQLFVPPDRALGWPHGVQESDEPWAWRAAPALPGRRAIQARRERESSEPAGVVETWLEADAPELEDVVDALIAGTSDDAVIVDLQRVRAPAPRRLH
jgi:hypothetical protein